MSAPKPVIFQWDGEAMQRLPRFAALCDRQFVVGEHYTLVPHEPRSRRSHNHFFASVAEVWKNLPDHLARRFPSDNHLRKWALIRCGYADKKEIVLPSDTDAERVAAFMRQFDTYAVITINGPVLTVYTAQSQAESAMNKRLFQTAKDDVLGFLSDLIGADQQAVEEQARHNSPHQAGERMRQPIEEAV